MSMLALFALLLCNLCCAGNIRGSTDYVNNTDTLSLLGLKLAITNDPTRALSTWNRSIPVCQWNGVTCSLRHPGRVTALNLPGQGFTGEIASSIGNLTFLRELNLSSNALSGQLPSLNRLRKLLILDLSNNSLQGTISDAHTNCSGLRILDLSRNYLVGEIPPQVSLLSNLLRLRLSFNNLAGIIPPAISNITGLEQIALSYNQLTGNIPDELGKLSDLSRLVLGGNNLSGDIPPHSLFNMSSLFYLGLEQNRLGKILPQNIGDTLPNLELLALSGNLFEGPIAVSLGNASGLSRIDLSYNGFSGQVHTSLGNLPALYYLNLEGNSLLAVGRPSWEFMYALANCSGLEWLSLAQNQLQGTIPDAVGNLSSALQDLYLGGNMLSGMIPPSIVNLGGLAKLGLNDNSLTGTIEWIAKLANLQGVNLHGNNFIGPIP